jgi:uncharacterized membrane protein
MNDTARRPVYLVRVGKAHVRLLVSAVIGAIAAAVLPGSVLTRALLGWDLGVAIYLISAAAAMAHCVSVAQMERNAAAQDEGAYAVLALTGASALASLGAIFAELDVVDRSDPQYGLYGVLAVGTVLLSWTFVHTIFALHYAHDYYGGRHRGGLRFPEDEKPDYWDFVYFAFVVGMTFQVSDVAVTQKQIRRMVVAHGVLSFFFTTTVVAMMVNIAAGVIQK